VTRRRKRGKRGQTPFSVGEAGRNAKTGSDPVFAVFGYGMKVNFALPAGALSNGQGIGPA
jgi:hypothetical protein